MAEFSTYTHQFRAEGPAFKDARHRRAIKRTRHKLSCLPCTTRKLRCDRGHPCETCVKRSSEDACTYEKTTAPGQGNSRTQTHEKLVNLEQLVRQMMESEAVVPRHPDITAVTQPHSDHTSSRSGDGHRSRESDQMNEARGREQTARLLRSPSHPPLPQSRPGPDHTPPYAENEESSQGVCETRYKGSTHWSAILENIQELKIAVDAFPSTYADEDDNADVEIPEGEILFGTSVQYSIQQILSESLPPKVQVDRRLSAFFKTKTMIIPYIHTGYFQRQYQRFWENPLAATIGKATDSEPCHVEGQQTDRLKFLRAAAQCLVLGGYTRPQPCAVEALALYAQCKYMHNLDPSRELCIILSTVCRLAYMMGYHRDPDNYGNFTVFEGEMRRRAWSTCRQFDIMVSFQFGLPSNIHTDSLDTKSPRNLLDSDFDEHTKILPPSRPDTEPTPILYFVVKHNLLRGFTKVCNHALSLNSKSQAEILELDAELRRMYSSVPEGLRIRPMAQSLADPPFLIITRLYIAFLHQKSLCILHRGHMAQGHDYSTKACFDAATTIVTHFIDINKEFEVGGQLYSDRWALSSFNMNDFLLAVMILCLSLSMWKKRNPEKHVSEDPAARSQLNLLRQAYLVCIEKAIVSKESRRVVAAVKAILALFELQTSSHTATKDTALTGSHGVGSQPAIFNQPLSSSAVMTPFSDTYEGDSDTPQEDGTAGFNDDVLASLSLNKSQSTTSEPEVPSRLGNQLDPFQDILSDFENMDWTYLDQCLVGSNAYDFAGEADWINSQY